MTKYYVYRFCKNSGFAFKRTKTTDYWTHDFSVCWQYSKKGAENIVKFNEERKKNNLYQYGMVSVDEVEKMLKKYNEHEDEMTYIAECMNERPYWI